MDDYKEIFKRELDRLTYLYVKANTISKKKRIAYDLIAFDNMYNYFMDDEEVEFPWSNDEFLIDFRLDIGYGLLDYVLSNKFFLLDVVENSFNIFLENNFSTYCDYGKKFHKLEEEKLQGYIIDFYFFAAIRSVMEYIPALLPTIKSAALSAPFAKISREVAVCERVTISLLPANITSCSPTIVPPRIACIPISLGERLRLTSCLS